MRILDIFRREIIWQVILIVLAIGLIAYWGFEYTKPPEVVKIATGGKTGYYFAFGKILKKHIEKNTRLKVELLNTKGAVNNKSFLLSGKADLAILETGTISMQNLMAVAPLWEEFAQVVVRKDSTIRTFKDFKNRNVSIGKIGSGDRVNTSKIMEHYGIEIESLGKNSVGLGTLLKDSSLEVGIVTTSPMNPSLAKVMQTGKFTLLPIEFGEGLEFQYPYFFSSTIPKGVYQTDTFPEPEQQIQTVATFAILATTSTGSYTMVKEILPILYLNDLRKEVPGLMEKDRVPTHRSWNLLPIHPAARGYYNPYEGVQGFSRLIEKIGQIKYILLAVILLAAFLWYKWTQRHTDRERKEMSQETSKLEKWFRELADLEKAQKDAKDLRLLKQYLNEAHHIKKNARETAIGTRIQHSAFFVAFLQESTYLIQEIEWKLSAGNSEKKN